MKRILGIVTVAGGLAVMSGLFLCGRAAAVNGAPARTASAVTASERCSTASCTKCPIPCKLCPGPGSCSRGTSNPHVQMM